MASDLRLFLVEQTVSGGGCETAAVAHVVAREPASGVIANAAPPLGAGLADVEQGRLPSIGPPEMAPTVIRLTAGAGTLVFETDDPDVTIAVNVGEVTIRDGGVDELTLRPGDYDIEALKEGRPVK